MSRFDLVEKKGSGLLAFSNPNIEEESKVSGSISQLLINLIFSQDTNPENVSGRGAGGRFQF